MLRRREYLAEVWFTMHHSDDPNRQTTFLTCYLDDSGTDKKNPDAVVGGIVIDRTSSVPFDAEWMELLEEYKIKPYPKRTVRVLHMNEFGPHGKDNHLSLKERFELFTKGVATINKYKKYSVAGTLSKVTYDAIVIDEGQRAFSEYGFCFISCAFQNHVILEGEDYKEDMAYLLDEGNEHAQHILGAYQGIKEWQKDSPFHVGSLGFDDDEKWSTLQAADVVAWAVRRRMDRARFVDGYEPIQKVYGENHHQEIWKRHELKELSESLSAYVRTPNKRE